MRIVIGLVLSLCALGGSPAAWAQQKSPAPAASPAPATPSPALGADGQLPPSMIWNKPLPEVKGVVSWKTLAEVQPVKGKNGFVPQFSGNVLALDKKDVKLQGFMMPLDMGEKQKRFILTGLPPSCAFCLPGGPDSMVEVQAKTPVKYGFEPIVLTGKLAVLKDDAAGLYYRLTDATVVGQ
jgi:hypothetical protein